MKRLFKKSNRRAGLLALMMALVCMCAAGFVFADAEATTGPVTVTHEVTDLKEHVPVGMTISADCVFFKDIATGKVVYDFVKANNYTAESLNPDIATAEVYNKYGSSYCVLIKGIAPGTATIRISMPGRGVVGEMKIEVLGPERAVIDDFPTGPYDVKRGAVITLLDDYEATWGNYFSTRFKTDECVTLVSSNPKVAAIETVSSTMGDQRVKAVGVGSATITATINQPNGLTNVVKTFDVNVSVYPKATKPTILDQIATGDTISYSGCGVGFRIKGQPAVYEFWRSTSPKKGFKKVGQITIVEDSITKGVLRKKGDNLMSYEAGEKLIFEDGKKVKQNTKYYYKMRMKYTGVEYDNSWSKWSRVTGAYWTGVKPFKFDDNRIKLNKKTRKVTIPKPSTKVKGYIYSVGASKHLGYNIFGQEVRYRSGARRITTKRIFKVKNIDGMRISVVYDVIPYTKHGKYYYVHGYKPMKNINRLKEYYGADKYVNY